MHVKTVGPDVLLISSDEKFAGSVKPNFYVLLGSKKTVLIDSGHPEEHVEPYLELFDEIPSPEHILLTHNHLDHSGMAGVFQREFGSKVWIHKDDMSLLQEGLSIGVSMETLVNIWKKLGMDDELTKWAYRRIEEFNKTTLPAPKLATPIECDGVLDIPGFSIRVVHTPGHTPGSCSFVEEKRNVIFTGDTLLPPGLKTPLPSLQIGGDPGTLKTFASSLVKLYGARPSVVFPGHGEPFGDLDTRIEKAFKEAEELEKAVFEALALEERWRTAFQISQEIAGEGEPIVRYITLGWVVEVLTVLECRGYVERMENHSAILWRKTSTPRG